MHYATQPAVSPQMYYASTGAQAIHQADGQSYVLSQVAATPGSSVTTTGAPVMYSMGPGLHNGTDQQHPSQSQQQVAYQITDDAAQPTTANYQMVKTTSNRNVTAQQQSASTTGIISQRPAQLVQRSNVIQQVRHHPYRN